MKKIVLFNPQGRRGAEYEILAQHIAQEASCVCQSIQSYLQDPQECDVMVLGYEEMDEQIEQLCRIAAQEKVVIYPFSIRSEEEKFEVMMELATKAVGARVRPCQCFKETESACGYLHVHQWAKGI